MVKVIMVLVVIGIYDGKQYTGVDAWSGHKTMGECTAKRLPLRRWVRKDLVRKKWIDKNGVKVTSFRVHCLNVEHLR